MFKLASAGRACVALTLSFLLLWCASAPAYADTLEELQEKQESLEMQKEENDAKLAELRDDKIQKTAYRDTLYSQIDTVQSQLTLLRRQIDGLNERIGLMEDQISKKQAEADANMDLFKERLKALYVAGEAPAVSLLLNSQNFMEFTDKIQLLKAVAKHDRQLIDELSEQIDEMEGWLSFIRQDKEELANRKKELDSKNAELAGLYQEAQQMVDNVENEEWVTRANSEILGSQMEENEDAIRELEEQIRSERAASGLLGTDSFIWPMPGYTYLTCYFGEDGHRGIDIAGGDIYGKPIIAADGGTVIYAGWNDSYGYCVFIDHGNGYETRYAHMSELGTVTGAKVGQGETIGYVGSTGNSTGPHLHFEVILGEELTNPMGYF